MSVQCIIHPWHHTRNNCMTKGLLLPQELHECVLVLDRRRGRAAQVLAVALLHLDFEEHGALHALELFEGGGKGFLAVGSQGIAITYGLRDCGRSIFRPTVGWPPTESCAPLLNTTCT